MKKLMISALALAALVSCSSEDILDGGGDNGKVAIQLKADIVKYIETKAAPAQATDALLVASATTNDYSTFAFADANITLQTDGKIDFGANKQYYPSTGSTLYMKSISPRPTATPTNGTALYTIDGSQDVMLSGEISGSKTDSDSKTLTFSPLLTKISFKADRDGAFATDFTVTSITFSSVPTKLDLNISTGAIIQNATEAGVSDLQVGGTMPTAKTTAEATANQIYLLPAAQYSLLVKAPGFPDAGVSVTITPNSDSEFEASKAYTITLHFKGKEISGTADITDRTEIDNVGKDII